MIDNFVNTIAPFAAIGFIGWGFARFEVFSRQDAQSINRFVFYIALPALMFQLIALAPRDAFNLTLAGGYLLSELVIYFTGFAIAYFGFRRDRLEAILIGMVSAFVNHVFFVLPVAIAAHGSSAIAPVMSIVVIDSIFLYAGTILVLDILTTKRLSPFQVLRQTFRNPHIVGIVAGLVFNVSDLAMPIGVANFTAFVSAAASPAAIFTLGLILGLRNDHGDWPLPISIALLKSAVHPVLLLLIFVAGMVPGPKALNMAILVAAGPCGALPFVLALHYKINERAIAQTILVSSIISLAGLSILI